MRTKRMFRIAALLLACLMALGLFAACSKKNKTIEDGSGAPFPGKDGVEYSYSTYNNADYSDYMREESETVALPGQWEDYGVGDPFIMRYNGMYYLYCSTKNGNIGVRAWKSSDLVHWEQCQGAGLTLGYVSEDERTMSAYAPEVYYMDGTFYMYTSPGGSGHVVLRSESPEGPFVYAGALVDNNIDGNLFIADDESMYFLFASNGAITVKSMDDMLNYGDKSGVINATMNLGGSGWTEGPDVFTVDGITYLTYAGNSVTQNSYRINIVAAEELDTTSVRNFASSFVNEANGPFMINTDGEAGEVGIGHSSTVLGPDLNSHYIAYHTLNSTVGPNRSFNLDRLLIAGTYVSTVPLRSGSVAPTLPAFAVRGAEGLAADGSFLLSPESVSGNFTAEFNSAGDAGMKYVVGYTSANEYFYVTVDYSGKSIAMYSVEKGKETLIQEGILKNSYSSDANHTIRISSAEGTVRVYFDEMCKIVAENTRISDGKIGYLSSGNATYGYTAYSLMAGNLSDRKEIKQSAAYIPAISYMTEGMIEGVESFALSKDSGVTKVDGEQNLNFGGSKMLKLANTGDFGRYLVRFAHEAHYGIELMLPAQYCDGEHRIGVEVDGGDVIMATVPYVASEYATDIINVRLLDLDVGAGVHQIRIENVGGGAIELLSFRFFVSSKSTPKFEHDLSTIIERGAWFEKDWDIGMLAGDNVNAYIASEGARMLLYFGDDTVTDFKMSVSMALPKAGASGGGSGAGLIFRAGNYFDGSKSSDNNDSIQGYYLAVYSDAIILRRCNYGDSVDLSTVRLTTASGKYYTYTVSMKGNQITVLRDGEQILQIYDTLAFTHGRIGLYTTGNAAYYKNLSISGS